jgi:hypothetical protein
MAAGRMGRFDLWGVLPDVMVGRACGHYELTSPVVPVWTPSCRRLNFVSALSAVHAA